jgi:hypothetical protein
MSILSGALVETLSWRLREKVGKNPVRGSAKLLRDRLACQLSRHGESAVQPKMRRLYLGFPKNRVMMHESVSKMIGDKRPTFKELIIRNY